MEPLESIDVLKFQKTKLLSPYFRRFFWKTKVKILIVVDGGIAIDTSSDFGINKVIDIIESNEFFPCANFQIHCAQRTVGVPSVNSAANSHQFRYLNFRFNMAGFNINDYDQVWFFGINPGNSGSLSDAPISQAHNSPMTDQELVILGQWMDNKGGGVFAVGDHHFLGASMCSRIPRVRNMRRWTNAQGVPPVGGFLRHDTNQPTAAHGTTIPFAAQGDSTPQPIEVLKKVYYGPIFYRKNFVPHPILCGVDGVIEVLPDHPHEGETLGVRYDTGTGGVPVDTTLTTGISGYNVAEYPAGINGNPQPIPEIIALGHPINDSRHEKNRFSTDNSHANETTSFGLASVYDGEKAGVGRVVVDSTWHHWMDININGFASNAPVYKQIRNYFMNVAAWLCRKSLRDDMLFCTLWDYMVLEYEPMRFGNHSSIWYLGTQARDVLGRVASRCTTTEWIELMFEPIIIEKFRPVPGPFPCLSCPPFEAFEVAVLGGIMKSMLPLVEEYMEASTARRVKVDPKKIAKLALEGIEIGQKAYMEAFEVSKKNADEMLQLLPKSFKKNNGVTFNPTIEKLKLRIEADSVVFKDGRIPLLLATDKYHLEFNLSVNGGEVTTRQTISCKDGLKFSTKDAFNNLVVSEINLHLCEDIFEEGEELTVDLYLVYQDCKDDKRNKLWQKTFTGSPNTWMGSQQLDLFDKTDQDFNKVDVLLSITEAKKK